MHTKRRIEMKRWLKLDKKGMGGSYFPEKGIRIESQRKE